MRSDLVFEAMEAPLRPFSTYKTTRKTPTQTAKYSHTGHDERCIGTLQWHQPNSTPSACPATNIRPVAPRKLRRRPSARVESAPYRGGCINLWTWLDQMQSTYWSD